MYSSKTTCFSNASHEFNQYQMALLLKYDGKIPQIEQFCGGFRSKQIKDNKNENQICANIRLYNSGLTSLLPYPFTQLVFI